MREQSAATSSALIDHFRDNPSFLKLSDFEQKSTIQRDNEDGEKLQLGIDLAKSRGVIDPNYVPQPYMQIDVLGKSPEQVAQLILQTVEDSKQQGESSSAGFVIVLCGLSGTGKVCEQRSVGLVEGFAVLVSHLIKTFHMLLLKGTTVSILRQKMEQEQGKTVVTWSNGNIFRAVTLLSVTWWEQQQPSSPDATTPALDPDQVLTKENLASFMSMLSFGKHPTTGQYDTHIKGLGLDYYVSDVQNTLLKGPKVSSNIPTVAQFTQGEVILFAAQAIDTMVSNEENLVVLLEGREQTVNYVRSPHRFTLVLSDESLIGKRRAAQRVMAEALQYLPEEPSSKESEEVLQAVDKALQHVVAEM